MTELSVTGAEVFWFNYFFSLASWREVEDDIGNWGGKLVFNRRMPGVVDKIIFDDDADATAFLLRFA